MINSSFIGLDVGSVRIGVATAHNEVRIAHPLTTLQQGPAVFDEIIALVAQYNPTAIVVGWPRGLDGQATAQTEYCIQFAQELQRRTNLKVHLQDEALTSHKAESELQQRKRPYAKAEVDALAAAYILEDYLSTVVNESSEVGDV